MLISILFFLVLVPWSCATPSGIGCDTPPCKRTQDGDGNDPKRTKLQTNGTTVVPTCLYRGGRRTVDGKITRPPFSKVSTSCGGGFTRLSDLASSVEFLGTHSELQLILARGSAVFTKDFTDPEVVEEYSDQYICHHHRDELSLRWTDRHKFSHYSRTSDGKPKCSYPDEYHGDSRPETKALNVPTATVSFEDAKAFMFLNSTLLPVGLPVCPYHKEMLAADVARISEAENPASPTGGSLRSGAQHHPPADSSPDDASTVDPKIVAAFRNFASSAGESRLTGWKPLAKMDKRSVQKKTLGIRRLFDLIFDIAGKSDKQKLAEMTMSSRAAQLWQTKRTSNIYDELMRGVAERFYNAPGRREKELSLAMIAFKVPIREIRVYIPGLSERLYYKAKRMAFSGIKIEQEKYLRVRFNPAKLAPFIEFITSPLIMSDLPFGEKKVVASDGRKYKIPNSLRLQRASEIVHMYTTSMIERNLGHLLFAKSTLYKILSYCTATERKATVCADYFYSESELAYGDLYELVVFLHEKKAASKEWREEMEAKLKEVRFYMKGDYRIHTRRHSRVADHCQSHALSDKSNSKLSTTCDNKVAGETHVHDMKCDRCELSKEVMVDLRQTLEEYEKEVDKMAATDEQKRLKEDVDDRKAKFEQAEERIEQFKKHQLRSAYSNQVRLQMVEDSEENVASVILDFAQRFLPRKHLESQVEYFGKKGLSVHVSHVQTRKSGRIAQHLMYHIINTDQQDSVSVIQIIRHLLEELKKASITAVFLRSDNGACYHSASTIAAVYQLAKDAGVKVKLYGFSEAQNGKSASDRGSAMLKNKVRAYVNAGGDASSHEQFFTAATSGRLLEGASVYLVSTQLMKAPPVKLSKVSEFNDFEYEENGIRMWRHKSIGEGVFLPATSFEKSLNSLPKLTVVKSHGHLPGSANFWKLSPILAATCPKEDLPTLLGIAEKKEFHCPEITCISSFDTADELDAHWLAGVHCESPMTCTLRDESLKMFSAGLENALSQRLDIPEVDDAIKELEQSESDAEKNVEPGWALKTRKSVVRFSDQAKRFIEQLFDEGITLKKKIQPEEAERRMANERKNGVRVFSVEERLNARQIASYYSRIAAGREAAAVTTTISPATTTSTAPTRATRARRITTTTTLQPRFRREDADLSENGDKQADGDISGDEVFEDPWYYDSHDLVVSRIMMARNEIFDPNLDVEVDIAELTEPHSPLRKRRHHHHHHKHHHRHIHNQL